MTRADAASQPIPLGYQASQAPPRALLFRQLFALALPVLAENILHMVVGINDTYLANKLHHLDDRAPAGAAVGTITYFLWFFGLLVSSVGAGTTAIIARAKGARHRSLANSVTGQSMTAAILIGLAVGAMCYAFAEPIIHLTGLQGAAPAFALPYLRMLSVTLPFTMAMQIAGSCQRGYGDTLTAAVVMIAVDIVNAAFSWALCRGWWGFPEMGFNGIALGTIIAYVFGGVVQCLVLLRGRNGLKLYLHRLQPHWVTIKRLVRIGLPAMLEGVLMWIGNFGVVRIINTLDPSNAMPNAHMNAIRIESMSFMTGLAFAAAAATMVGQSLGMRDPKRAQRSAFCAYAAGGGAMTFFGLLFIFFGSYPAAWLSPDPHIADLTARCLRITGFIQSGFAASLVFSGALRGAGDTFVVMLCNLLSVLGIRLVGVLIVGGWLRMSLAAIWVVLAGELFFRGILAFARFLHGGWKHVKV
jgi:putative MATE family efflux protein